MKGREKSHTNKKEFKNDCNYDASGEITALPLINMNNFHKGLILSYRVYNSTQSLHAQKYSVPYKNRK